MRDILMVGITLVEESPYEDDVGETDFSVVTRTVDRFIELHGKDDAERKIREQFERAMEAAGFEMRHPECVIDGVLYAPSCGCRKGECESKTGVRCRMADEIKQGANK